MEMNDKGCRLFSAIGNEDWSLAEQLICPETANYCEDCDEDETTVLHFAVEFMAPKRICRLLLRAKANPRVKDVNDDTPLHIASSRSYDFKLLEYLVAAQADVNAQNWRGYTPLMSCVENGTFEQMTFLLERGADPFIRSYSPDTQCARQIVRNNPGNGIELRDGSELSDYLGRIEMQFVCCKRAQTVFVGIFRRQRQRSFLSHDMVRMIGSMIWATRMDNRWRRGSSMQ